MGRASGNGMSGVLIYTRPQDWSDWEAWKLLLKTAHCVGLKGPRLDEIKQLKDRYYNCGTKNRRRYAELLQEVENMYLDKLEKQRVAPKVRKPVKARRRLR